MVKRPRSSHHRAREQASAKRKGRDAREQTAAQVHEHPMYGAIPLISVTWQDADGKSFKARDYDPDYRPPLPSGAVRGDVRRQEFCRMCHVPKYFYVDQEKTCVQCGRGFIFGAAEQKHWYETLKFHFDSVAIRCIDCRRKRRSDHALREQLAAAKAALRDTPDDLALLLAAAEATVRYHQRTGEGNLDEAIAMARKATNTNSRWHGLGEALFWEAWCHALAGRREKARPLFSEFIERGGKGGRRVKLGNEARAWLAQNVT